MTGRPYDLPAQGRPRPFTLRDLLSLQDAGVIPDHVVDRIERGAIFAFELCWCARDRDDHPSHAMADEPGVDHEAESSGTRSLHRLLGLGQQPLTHSAERHGDTLREQCVPCRMDRWRVAQVAAARGHLDLQVGDFGWWHCRACEERGDDWSDPADYPCTAGAGVTEP